MAADTSCGAQYPTCTELFLAGDPEQTGAVSQVWPNTFLELVFTTLAAFTGGSDFVVGCHAGEDTGLASALDIVVGPEDAELLGDVLLPVVRPPTMFCLAELGAEVDAAGRGAVPAGT